MATATYSETLLKQFRDAQNKTDETPETVIKALKAKLTAEKRKTAKVIAERDYLAKTLDEIAKKSQQQQQQQR